MFVQRLKDLTEYTGDGEPILDTFGEVKQVWHPWRRRYDLFIRSVSSLPLRYALTDFRPPVKDRPEHSPLCQTPSPSQAFQL